MARTSVVFIVSVLLASLTGCQEELVAQDWKQAEINNPSLTPTIYVERIAALKGVTFTNTPSPSDGDKIRVVRSFLDFDVKQDFRAMSGPLDFGGGGSNTQASTTDTQYDIFDLSIGGASYDMLGVQFAGINDDLGFIFTWGYWPVIKNVRTAAVGVGTKFIHMVDVDPDSTKPVDRFFLIEKTGNEAVQVFVYGTGGGIDAEYQLDDDKFYLRLHDGNMEMLPIPTGGLNTPEQNRVKAFLLQFAKLRKASGIDYLSW
ncbi:MAG: hypothetical protein AAF432_14130 [Planctomycetota bacterium]